MGTVSPCRNRGGEKQVSIDSIESSIADRAAALLGDPEGISLILHGYEPNVYAEIAALCREAEKAAGGDAIAVGAVVRAALALRKRLLQDAENEAQGEHEPCYSDALAAEQRAYEADVAATYWRSR